MKKIISVFILFLFASTTSSIAQAIENSEEVTVFKKANPKTNTDIVAATSDSIVTAEKMKNPNKKNETEVPNIELITTDQKQKNPKKEK